MRRNAIWRTPVPVINYLSCNPISIDGVLIPTNADSLLMNEENIKSYKYLKHLQYYPGCYDGKPVYSTNKHFGLDSLPIVSHDWKTFINHRSEGEFMYSIYPTIYSLTAATVVSCFLTIVVFTNTRRPSWLLILGSLLSSINLINILTSSMKFLAENISFGKAPGENLLNNIQLNWSFNVIDLFSVFILQICQVQIIMRLFSRQKEKRFAFFMGFTLSIISQVIWAISTFHSVKNSGKSDYDMDNDDFSIMPAFIYLMRIAMNMIYSVLICVYCFIKFEFIKKRQLILISLVSILSTNTQFAFFIADVSNVWVAELSEVFNSAGYVVSTVIVWEWINRVHECEKEKQTQGILGRPFYEDELGINNNVDRISLFVPENEKSVATDNLLNHNDKDSKDEDDGSSFFGCNHVSKEVSPDAGPNSYTNFFIDSRTKTETFINETVPDFITKTKQSLIYMTDQIIAYGLAVPRSVSASSRYRISSTKGFNKFKSIFYENSNSNNGVTSDENDDDPRNNYIANTMSHNGIINDSSRESIVFHEDIERENVSDNFQQRQNEIRPPNSGPTFVYSRAKVQIADDQSDQSLMYDIENDQHQEVFLNDTSTEETSSQNDDS